MVTRRGPTDHWCRSGGHRRAPPAWAAPWAAPHDPGIPDPRL